MDLQSQVLFEGMPSLEVVRRISDTPLVYYPSYVDQENIVSRIPERPKDRFDLYYIGRVKPDTNVCFVISGVCLSFCMLLCFFFLFSCCVKNTTTCI